MRLVVIVTGIIIFFIVFLNSIERVDFEYPELLAEQDDTYFMLAVDKFEQDEVYTSILRGNKQLQRVKNMTKYIPAFKLLQRNGQIPVLTFGDLDQAQERYPDLEIEAAPAILIFDNKRLIFKSYDMKESRKFLSGLK